MQQAPHGPPGNFKEIYQSSAQVCLADGRREPVWVRIEYDKYDPSWLCCTLLADQATFFFSELPEQCELIALGELEYPIALCGIYSTKQTGSEVSLEAMACDIGFSSDPLPKGEAVHITLELTCGRVLRGMQIREVSYDGTIKFRGDEPGPIEWGNEEEKRTAQVRYVYEEAFTGISGTTLQIERPSIWWSLKANGSDSLKDLRDRIEKEAVDIVALLSLCSRERVSWYEIQIETPEYRLRPRLYPRAWGRRVVDKPRSPRHLDPLVDHRDLINGGFTRLLQAFKACKYSEAIVRAIAFTVASRSKSALESNYILCHAALEAVVHDLTEDDSSFPRLSDLQWKQLSRDLESLLFEFGKQQDVSETAVDHAKSKLLELKRPPIANVVLHQVRALYVRVDDLWPQTIGFEQGLRRALELRNELSHRALAAEPGEIYKNLVRLRVLVERFILQVLDWPREKIWVWHDQEIKRVNRVE